MQRKLIFSFSDARAKPSIPKCHMLKPRAAENSEQHAKDALFYCQNQQKNKKNHVTAR